MAAAIAVTGGAAAIAIGAAVCTGASLGGSLGKMIGKHISGSDCGPVVKGVPTVLAGGMVAAVVGSNVSCTGPPMTRPHPDSMIAQGSSNVFIGSMPAARKGDKTTCGATIGYGCDTVIIGGEQVTYMEIQPEIPAWVDYGLIALGLLGGFGLLRAAGFTLVGTLARLGGATAGSFIGGWGGGKLAEALGYKPDSWGYDLLGLGGSVAGGWLGYKGAGKGYERILEPKAASLDDAGGHSYADHGAQTTPEQQAHRLNTGETPGGRKPVYSKGKKAGQPQIPKEASKFTSNEKHLEAYDKSQAELNNRIQNNSTNPNGREVIEVPCENCGESYSKDAAGNLTRTDVNNAKAVYQKNPTTGEYDLVTLYPEQ